MRSLGRVISIVGLGVALGVALGMTSSPCPALQRNPRTPIPGTLEWAVAFATAQREAHKKQVTVQELVGRYRHLLELYDGCASCRSNVYALLKDAIRRDFADQKAIDQIEEEEFADDPVELARVLSRTGRLDEAERVARNGLETVHRVTPRTRLFVVLADVLGRRGLRDEQEAIAKRLLGEEGLSPDSCWFPRVGDQNPAPYDVSIEAKDLPAKLAEIHAFYEQNKIQTRWACYYNMWLVPAGRFLHQRRPGDSTQDPALSALSALFPDGVVDVQEKLANTVSEPKTRAAILLSAAGNELRDPPNLETALRLLARAEAADSTPQTRLAILQMKLGAHLASGNLDEAHRVARTVISDFSQYDAACDACATPGMFNRASDWIDACGTLSQECSASGWPSRSPIDQFASSAADLEALLKDAPQEGLVPRLLTSLGEAIEKTSPERAARLEEQAIRHPASTLRFLKCSSTSRDAYEVRAERQKDFATALFLALLRSGSIPDRPADPISRESDVRIAYYRLRLGIESERNWKILLNRMSEGMEPGVDGRLPQKEFLDLFLQSARVAHKVPEAVEWFQALHRRYRDTFQTIPRDPRLCDAAATSHVTTMLDGYVRDLCVLAVSNRFGSNRIRRACASAEQERRLIAMDSRQRSDTDRTLVRAEALQLHLSADKQSYVVSEPVVVTYSMTNLSEQPVEIFGPYADRPWLQIAGEDLIFKPYSPVIPVEYLSSRSSRSFVPHEVVSRQMIVLANAFSKTAAYNSGLYGEIEPFPFARPGRYFLRCAVHLFEDTDPLWSNPVEIVVSKAKPEDDILGYFLSAEDYADSTGIGDPYARSHRSSDVHRWEAYVRARPKSPYTPFIAFHLGESYVHGLEVAVDPVRASEIYALAATRATRSFKDDCLIGLAESQIAGGDMSGARATVERLLREYPMSDTAERARKILGRLARSRVP